MKPESPTEAASLGSLAQAARGKQLRSARAILIIIGVLTVAMNAFLFANARTEVDAVIEAELKTLGATIADFDPAAVAEQKESALRTVRLLYGGMLSLGVVFILLGIFIYAHPVAITVTGLVLYVAVNLGLGLLEPTSLVRGLVMKAIFVLLLARSITTAIAYQREKARVVSERGPEEMGGGELPT